MPGSNGNSTMPSFEGAPSGSTSPVVSSGSAGSSSSGVGFNLGSSIPGEGIAVSLINGLFQSRQNRLNREWQEGQNDLAWQRQRQLIDEQRAYDSPKAQMERLMDAGLNPNLIYGSLSEGHQAVGAPNAAGTYQGVAPQIDPNAMLLDAQASALRAQAGLDTSQTNRLDSLTPHEVENMIADTWLKGQSGEKISAESSMILQQSEYIKSQVAYVDTLTGKEKVDLSNKIIDLIFREAHLETEYDAYGAKLGMTINEYNYAVASFSLRLLGIKYNNANLAAMAHLNSSQAQSIDASLPYLDSIYKANKQKAVIDAGISGQQFIKGQKDNNWYTADKIFEYTTGTLQGVGSVISPFKFQLGGPKPIGFRRP